MKFQVLVIFIFLSIIRQSPALAEKDVSCLNLLTLLGVNSTEDFGRVEHSVMGEIINPIIHITGESSFIKKAEIIDAAIPGDRLDMAYFILENDYTSSYLASKLIQKAKQGVKVRILIDYYMSERYKDFLGYLASQGVEIKRFRPPTTEFMRFLKEDMGMQEPHQFIEGLTLQKTDFLMNSLKNSKLGLAGQEFMKLTQEAGQDPMMFLIWLQTSTVASDLMPLMQTLREHVTTYLRRLHHKILLLRSSERFTRFQVEGRNWSDEYHLSLGNELLKGRSYPFIDSGISGKYRPKNLIDHEKRTRTLEESFDELWGGSEELYEVVRGGLTSEKRFQVEALILERAHQIELQMSQLKRLASQGDIKPLRRKMQALYVENFFDTDVRRKEITEAFINGIKSAKKHVTIISAYFFLFPEVREAIRDALRRGVQVKVYTNSFFSTDLNIVNLATYKALQYWLTDFGNSHLFEIFELGTQPGQGSLHVKAIQIDNKVLGIGSANFDFRTHLYDSNNMVFLDLERDPLLGEEVVQAYIKQFGAYSKMGDLPWVKLTLDKAQKFLEDLKTKKPAFYHLISNLWVQQQI